MSQQTVHVMRLDEVKKQTGLSKTAIYDMMKKDKFPKNSKLGDQRTVGWKSSTIEEWIEQQFPEK